jgi:uncharacterized RDD family membrane protein YckC
MDVWIIRDGEKTGPIHDFEIRRLIEKGEISATTPAWHEGLNEWLPLGRIELFSREFEKPVPSGDMREAGRVSPPPLPSRPFLIRRFWARWFDLYLYSAMWWTALRLSGRDIGDVLQNPWMLLLLYVPWFALEAVLIHRLATTPGKWLLGIRVVNDSGSHLSLPESVRRAFRVLFIGIGFGWDIVCLICQIVSLVATRRLGKPLWDHVGGHRLDTTPLHPARIAAFMVMLAAALALQAMALFPYALREAARQNPEILEQWEKLRNDFSGHPVPPNQ